MADTVIDAATFAELQEAAGADFVGELLADRDRLVDRDVDHEVDRHAVRVKST